MMRGWMVMAAALLLAAPTALAAEATFTGRAELPLEVEGLHSVAGQDPSFLLEGDSGTVAFLLQGADGEATRVIHRAFGYVNMQDPKLAVLWDDTVETRVLPLEGSLLSLDVRRPEFRLLAYDGDLQLGSGAGQGPLLVGALESAKTVDYSLDRALSLHLSPPDDTDRFSRLLPAGTFQARADDGRLQSDGALRLFVTDAELTYRGPTSTLEQVPAHFRIEVRPGAIYNPLAKTWSGPGSHVEYVQEYLLVDVAAGHLDLNFAGVPGSLYSARPDVQVDGEALLPAMDGTVTVIEDGEPTRHHVRGEDLSLGGRFSLLAHDALGGPARAQVEGSGDVTHVAYAGARADYGWAAVATAAGASLLLVAVAWLAASAKAVGGLGGLLAGYARVSGDEVLEHPGRQEVYERVKASPGINFVQLCEQVEFGASTLTYHLRVLERNEYVTSVKDGRYLRFFDRQGGAYSGAKKVAVSALRNASSAAMARHIRANPGVNQRDLAVAFGVTASTVNWHMTRLQSAGLVERQRDSHFTRYYLSQAGWSQLPAAEIERLDVLATPTPAPQAVVAPILA
jgi:DNA-binding transcriptional ArsR family regulator